MAITLEESGLTQEQYNALMYQHENPAWKVVAHRYDLDFALVDNGMTRVDKSFWDAIPLPSLGCVALMMTSTIRFFEEDGVTEAYDAVTLTSVTESFYAPSLFWDDDAQELHVFYGTSTAISRRTYALDAGEFALQSTTAFVLGLGANETVKHIAAVAANRLHYIIGHSTRRTNQFAVATTAAATKSRIYYQYPIQSFSAVEFGGKDIIVVSTQIPGAIAIETIGQSVKKSVEYAGGILEWTYADGIWSDHYEIDTVDRLNSPNVRKSVRLSVAHDRLALTCYAASGAAPFITASYRLYTSKDGTHWSFGRIMPIDTGGLNHGLKIAAISDSVLLCDFGGIYRSDCTLELGYSPASMQIDITSYIPQYSLSQDGAASAAFVIENENGLFDDHEIINDENRVVLEHFAGYWVNGEALMVLVATTEVDYIKELDDGHEKTIEITSRDFSSWMTDTFSSENSQYWQNQLIGGDNFLDNTDTRYGGLRHTITQSGTWVTTGSVLEVAVKNKESIAFGTFSAYIWNGVFETKFRLSQNSNSEKAGLIFRALDKDNMFAAIYEQANDKIHLYEIRAATETQVAVQSGTMSWSTAAVSGYRWLKVSFYYGLVKVFSSNDGITWVEKISYIATGQNPAGTVATILLDKGFVGYLGKGHYPETTTPLPNYNLPDYSDSAPEINDGAGQMVVVTTGVDPSTDYSTPEEDLDNNSEHGTYDFWSVLYDFGTTPWNPATTANKTITGEEAFSEWELRTGVYDGEKVQIPSSSGSGYANIYKLFKTDGFTGIDEPEEIHKVRVGLVTSHTAAATDMFIDGAFKFRYVGADVDYIYEYDPPDSGSGLVVKYGLEVALRGFFNQTDVSGGIKWIEIFGKGFFRP